MPKLKLLIITIATTFLSLIPITAHADSPTLQLSAQMGATFSTIDVKLTLHSPKNSHPSIYYLALAKDFKNDAFKDNPDAETILNYINGKTLTGLNDGSVVRGYWIASSQYTSRIFSLSGKENIQDRVMGENGFKDGQIYDIFMIAINKNGTTSNVAVAEDIMAMPFDTKVRENTFTLANGRQLANIARLDRQFGNFSEHSYILASDIDMQYHPNWTPMDFSGNFDGRNHIIKNMSAPLFNTLEGALIQNVHVQGKVNGSGGLASKAIGSVFKDCHVHVDVEGTYRVGGFVGSVVGDAIFANCHSYGKVSGEREVGGFVGWSQGNQLSENAKHGIKIVQCHSYGDVYAKTSTAGGFAGVISYTGVDAASCTGNVYVAGHEAGGFVGRLTHRSRITNACAYGDVVNKDGKQTGGFVGLITHGSGVQHAFSAGNVYGGQDTGGFAGVISLSGAPNTLFGCISFAKRVCSSHDDDTINRLVGRADHKGVNNCYSYLGSIVADAKSLKHVQPNAYGVDGADVNNQTIDNILQRIGWDKRYWIFSMEDSEDDPIRKPRIIFTDR